MTHEPGNPTGPETPVPHADRDKSEQPRRCAWCGSGDCDARIERTPSTATAGSDPTQGTSRAEAARVVRASEAQVKAARSTWRRLVTSVTRDSLHALWQAVADAVVAAGDANEVTLAEHGRSVREVAREVYGAEVERLRAELKRLGLEVAKVARERSAAEGRAESWKQVADDYNAEIVAAHAERDRLAEVVARVRSKAVAYRKACNDDLNRRWNDTDHGGRLACDYVLQEIEAALSGPTPAETPQNGPEPALSREQGTSGQSGEGEALRGAERCHGDRDGDCSWLGCPQLRDGEPVATGRHCPLDTREEGR